MLCGSLGNMDLVYFAPYTYPPWTGSCWALWCSISHVRWIPTLCRCLFLYTTHGKLQAWEHSSSHASILPVLCSTTCTNRTV